MEIILCTVIDDIDIYNNIQYWFLINYILLPPIIVKVDILGRRAYSSELLKLFLEDISEHEKKMEKRIRIVETTKISGKNKMIRKNNPKSKTRQPPKPEKCSPHQWVQ